MQPPTNINIAPVQTGQVILAQRPQSTLNVPVIRALAITQIVFGSLTVILGIIPIAAISEFWINFIGFGIWFGVWIVVTGIIGIFSARKPQSGALNGTNMGFNIFCSVVSLINGGFFAGAIAYYNDCRLRRYVAYYSSYGYTGGYYSGSRECDNKDAGMAIYSLLVLLMVAEFFVSLFISIFCCKGGCCCRQEQRVMGQQPVGYSANGSAVITTNTGYPQTAYPGTAIMHSSDASVAFQAYPQQGQMQMYPQQGQMMVQQNPQQGQMQMYPQQGQMMLSQNPQQRQMIFSQPGMIAGQTNAVYVSDQQPQMPPEYKK